MDPLSPEYPWYTPYQFAGNKPINSIDLDGLEEFKVVGKYGYEATTSGIPFKDEAAAQEWADKNPMKLNYTLPDIEVAGEKYIGLNQNGGPNKNGTYYSNTQYFEYSSFIDKNFTNNFFSAKIAFQDAQVKGQLAKSVSVQYNQKAYAGSILYERNGSAKMNLNAHAAAIEAKLQFSGEKGPLKLGVGAEGGIWIADGGFNYDFKNTDSKIGFKLGANLGAYTFKGEVTGSAELKGLGSFSSTVGGSLASAHLGMNMRLLFDKKTYILSYEGLEHAGFGVGQKLGGKGTLDFSYPVSWYMYIRNKLND